MQEPNSALDGTSLHGRQLMAKVRSSGTAGGGSGFTSDAVPSAYVSSQNWTVADLAVASKPIGGAVLLPRTFGRNNALLGGLVRMQPTAER